MRSFGFWEEQGTIIIISSDIAVFQVSISIQHLIECISYVLFELYAVTLVRAEPYMVGILK